jgi:hypothetical protein
MEMTSAEQYEPERKVEATDVLLEETVERLARDCPPPLLGTAARESLEDLRPHVEEALEALGEIEGRRDLTDEVLSRRHSFKMLLAKGCACLLIVEERHGAQVLSVAPYLASNAIAGPELPRFRV